MLRGKPDLPPELEDRSLAEMQAVFGDQPREVVYNPNFPIGYFDFIVIREVFGKGDAFCQKITYKVTGRKPEDLINDFRNSYNPRIAVTVDMIATGTDVRPLEVLLFMRNVNSANFCRQMRGRGTRVVSETELQSVTPGAQRKTHFVRVDAGGVGEHPKIDPGGVDRKRSVPLATLLERFAFGIYNEDDFESLAVRLARLDNVLTDDERAAVESLTGGKSPRALAAQEASGKVFTEGQRWWLDRIAEAIGVNLTVTARDFQYGELFQRGGWHAAQRAFGDTLPALDPDHE